MLYNFFVIESLRLKHLERLQYSNTLNNSSDKGKEYNVLTRLQVTRSPQKQWGWIDQKFTFNNKKSISRNTTHPQS